MDGKLEPAIGKYIDGWNRHDAFAVVAAMAPTALYHDPTLPAGGVDVAEFLSLIERTLSVFPDLRLDVKSVHSSNPNRSAVEIVMRGVLLAPAAAETSHAATAEIHGCLVFDVTDGQIRTVTAYYDPAAANVFSQVEIAKATA